MVVPTQTLVLPMHTTPPEENSGPKRRVRLPTVGAAIYISGCHWSKATGRCYVGYQTMTKDNGLVRFCRRPRSTQIVS